MLWPWVVKQQTGSLVARCPCIAVIHFRAKVRVKIGFSTAKFPLEQLTNTVLSFVVNRYVLFTVRIQPNVLKCFQPKIMIYLNSIHGATYQIIGFTLIDLCIKYILSCGIKHSTKVNFIHTKQYFQNFRIRKTFFLLVIAYDLIFPFFDLSFKKIIKSEKTERNF